MARPFPFLGAGVAFSRDGIGLLIVFKARIPEDDRDDLVEEAPFPLTATRWSERAVELITDGDLMSGMAAWALDPDSDDPDADEDDLEAAYGRFAEAIDDWLHELHDRQPVALVVRPIDGESGTALSDWHHASAAAIDDLPAAVVAALSSFDDSYRAMLDQPVVVDEPGDPLPAPSAAAPPPDLPLSSMIEEQLAQRLAGLGPDGFKAALIPELLTTRSYSSDNLFIGVLLYYEAVGARDKAALTFRACKERLGYGGRWRVKRPALAKRQPGEEVPVLLAPAFADLLRADWFHDVETRAEALSPDQRDDLAQDLAEYGLASLGRRVQSLNFRVSTPARDRVLAADPAATLEDISTYCIGLRNGDTVPPDERVVSLIVSRLPELEWKVERFDAVKELYEQLGAHPRLAAIGIDMLMEEDLSPLARSFVGESYAPPLLLAARDAIATGDLVRAERILDKLKPFAEFNHEIHAALIELQLAGGDVPAALRTLRAAVESDDSFNRLDRLRETWPSRPGFAALRDHPDFRALLKLDDPDA